MTIKEFITFMSKNKIVWYLEGNRTEEEEREYYESGEYELHLTYLIDTWISNTKNEYGYNDEILDDPMLDPIFNMDLVSNFNEEWLDDIFEHHILDRVVLK
jgi:hypothetical protein